MQFIYRVEGAEHELELRLGRPDATIGDLADALRLSGGISVDGRPTGPETALAESGLVAGSVVSRVGRAPTMREKPLAVLRIVGGLESGRNVALSAGRVVIGRGAQVDISVDCLDVSRVQCAIEVSGDGQVTVTDLDSQNGTDVNGVRISAPTAITAEDLVSLAGQVLLQVLPAGQLEPVQHVNPVREARPGGILSFNRAPRPAAPPGPAAIRLPKPPDTGYRSPFSIAMMFGPLLLAGVMVTVMNDPRYALIAVLSPMIFIGDFIESRTRGRISLRKGRRTYAKELAAAKVALEQRHRADTTERRRSISDPAELLTRAQSPGLKLWERRPSASDFLQVCVGLADLPWQPPVLSVSEKSNPDEEALLTAMTTLPQVPAVASISAGAVVGLTGDRAAAMAVARSLLCQAVVTSGPADVTLALFTDPDRVADWDWTKWLPHGADLRSGSNRLVAIGDEACVELARALIGAGSPAGAGRVVLVVVDGATLLEGRPNPLRELLAGASVRCGGIVLTNRLPALCTSVVTARNSGIGRLHHVTTGEEIEGILLTGVTGPTARRVARSLARFEDPESRVDGAGLPDSINLLPLLDLPEVSGAVIAARWKEAANELRVGAVLGVTERDIFRIDLDDDGPHGLIAGTTGSGKSELLRTMISSMAVGTGPEHLTFALVDYKGGGALDECARLPHVVGLVTDLDEQLGQRALRCMEAELRHREHALRDVGLSHVREYQRLRDNERRDLEPMPRLIVVIDEFATLVKALPDFVDSLVSIAQRGRSLGMHLIMATQRPAGSVSDAIKNNVKLRLALRLESAGDSIDVIDSPVAAGIGSRQWGRAYYRLSMREMLPVQTALSTGVTAGAASTAPVTVAPFWIARIDSGAQGAGVEGTTDLQRLVAASQQACEVAGIAPPRRPWPDPLPVLIGRDSLAVTGRALQSEVTDLPALALADDPDQQTQYAVSWEPEAGNLLIYGSVGAGATTTLATLALAVAGANPPDRQHLFVLDLGAGELAPLGGLPHTGAYIGAGEKERQVRLIRMLREELDARKGGAPQPSWLVLVDNMGALTADFDKDAAGMSLMDDLARVFADGPAVKMYFALTADRGGAIPPAWSALAQQKLVMRLGDSGGYSNFDIPRKAVPAFVPGRAVIVGSHQVVQIAHPGPDLAAAVREVAQRWPGAQTSAPAVGLLPVQIDWAELGAGVSVGAEPWTLPIGIGDRKLAPVGLSLYEHEHALITGPPRSGRSSALCSIALAALDSPQPPAVVAFAPRRSPLRELPSAIRVHTDLHSLGEELAQLAGPVLVLVDDAETVSDDAGVLEQWLVSAGPGRHLIAAGRADGVRRSYGGWLMKVRDGRTGVLLVPDYDMDGDLLGVVLPRRDRLAPLPGRGYLVANGSIEGVQLAQGQPSIPQRL